MSYAHTLSDALGTTTYAGFTPTDIAAYFGQPTKTAAAQALIDAANGVKISPARAALILQTWSQASLSGPIKAGLQHLAQHPKGSHYHGDINVLDTIKNIALNIATYGLYSIGKSTVNIAKGGKVIPNVKTALASQGIAGGILTPAVGTNKSLLIQSIIAGGALAAAAKAGSLTGASSTLVPTALKAATPMVTGPAPAPVPSGLSPQYNPGYASTPLDQQYNPNQIPSDPTAGFGPNIDPTTGLPVTAQASMFGGLSPLMLVGLFGVPLIIQFFMKGTSKK